VGRGSRLLRHPAPGDGDPRPHRAGPAGGPQRRPRPGRRAPPLRSPVEHPRRRTHAMSTTKQRPRPGGPVTRRSYTPFIVLGVILVVAVGIALLASSGGDDAGSADGELLATAGITASGDRLPALPEGGDDPAEGTPAPTLEGVTPAGQGTSVAFDE